MTTKQDIDGEEETDSKNIEEDIGSNILTESSHTDTATHQTESSNTDAATAGCTLNLPVEPLRRASLVSIEDISLPEAHLVVHADPVNNLKKKTSNTNILIVVTFILIICSVSIPLALVLTKKNVGKHDPDVPDIQKYAELRKIIAPISGGDDIFDHQSPMASADRIAALDWMMNDTFTLSLMTLDTEWKIIQRYIIALIYFSTQGQHWYDQYSFLSGLDVCSWINAWREDEGFFKEEINAKGIICNERGRVTELRLYWNNLSGTFPYEISHLNETLSTINLNGGSISSSIPKTFGNLGKLKLLGLAENCLSGTVPNSLSKLNLDHLLLNGNINLSGSLNTFSAPFPYAVVECGSCPGSHPESQMLVECDFCICCEDTSFDCCDSNGNFLYTYYRLDPNPNAAGVPFSFSRSCLSKETHNWWKEECPCTVDNGEYISCTTNCITKDKATP